MKQGNYFSFIRFRRRFSDLSKPISGFLDLFAVCVFIFSAWSAVPPLLPPTISTKALCCLYRSVHHALNTPDESQSQSDSFCTCTLCHCALYLLYLLLFFSFVFYISFTAWMTEGRVFRGKWKKKNLFSKMAQFPLCSPNSFCLFSPHSRSTKAKRERSSPNNIANVFQYIFMHNAFNIIEESLFARVRCSQTLYTHSFVCTNKLFSNVNKEMP